MIDTFAGLVGRPDTEIPLDRACLLIADALVGPLDVDTELSRIDELASGVREPTLDGLRRHLFGDLGFRGDTTTYDDPANSMLPRVLDRRVGIPITLSVLTMETGRRIGVPVAGVGMPGHFLLRDRVDPDVFVDPFSGGVVLDRPACERVFRHLHGPDAAFDDAFLDPASRRSIVARILVNLDRSYAARFDWVRRATVLDLRTSVADSEDGATRLRSAAQQLRARMN